MSTVYCAVAQKSVCNIFIIIILKNIYVYSGEIYCDLEELTKVPSNTVITSLSLFVNQLTSLSQSFVIDTSACGVLG